MEHRSYRASDAEWEGIKAEQAKSESDRRARLSGDELILEGLATHEAWLVGELKRMRNVAARIPDMENAVIMHQDKIARYKAKHGL